MAGLSDANWKARLVALDEMTAWLEPVVDDVDAEIVIRALAKKGWGEKNFQVKSLLLLCCPILDCAVRYPPRYMGFAAC